MGACGASDDMSLKLYAPMGLACVGWARGPDGVCWSLSARVEELRTLVYCALPDRAELCAAREQRAQPITPLLLGEQTTRGPFGECVCGAAFCVI